MSYNITVTMDQLSVTDATESTPLVTIRKPTSGGSDVTVDTALSTSSYNPIANAPVATAINTVNASLTELNGDISDVEDDVTALQSQVGALSQGTPTAVSTAASMTDTTKMYLYTGSETGYTAGDIYAYVNGAWTDVGTYGTGTISTNARNLLKYILDRVAFKDGSSANIGTYIDALDYALRTGDEPTAKYDILYVLTGATSSNTASKIAENASYSTTLSPESGYLFDSVTVTMGGTDITSSAYTRSSGAVSIATVTGDIVITVVGVQPAFMVTAGTWTFTNSTYPGSVTVTMDNEGAIIEYSRTKAASIAANRANITHVTENEAGTWVNGYSAGSTALFTIANGATVTTESKLITLTSTTTPSNWGTIGLPVGGVESDAIWISSMATGLGTTVGTTYTTTKTNTADITVGDIFMHMSDKAIVTIKFTYKLWADGVRLI